MSDPLFGWDLTFKTIENDITKKSDVLVAFVHFNLVKRGFRCIGVGDDQTLDEDVDTSELLPSGWNSGQQYSLRYTLDRKLYILKGLLSDGSLVLNLMKAEDLAVSSLAFNIEETVNETKGSIDKLIPQYKDVMHKLKRDFVDSVCEKSTSTTETQTREEPERERSSHLYEPPPPQIPNPGSAFGWPEADPLRIGRSDLDPFARGGGGMLFDPFGNRPGGVIDPGFGIPGGLPRGAVPPGARFDPFAPQPDRLPPRRQPPPDSDDFMPPGSGNFYM